MRAARQAWARHVRRRTTLSHVCTSDRIDPRGRSVYFGFPYTISRAFSAGATQPGAEALHLDTRPPIQAAVTRFQSPRSRIASGAGSRRIVRLNPSPGFLPWWDSSVS